MPQTDNRKIEFRKYPDILGLSYVCGKDINHSFQRHVHSTCCINITLKSNRGSSRPGYYGCVKAGDIEIINPGEPHELFPWEGNLYSYQVLCFDISKYFSQIPEFLPGPIKDQLLLRKICQLGQYSVEKFSLIEIEEKLLNIIEHLMIYRKFNKSSVPTCNMRVVNKAKVYLEENYARNISIQQLSREIGLSPYHLIRVFKNQVGLSPHEYMNNYRIRQARIMLEDGKRLVEAAMMTGFVDQAHFSRCFKKIMGVPPGYYVKSYKR
ncbi:MAG: AraC family transcriptional regulator [Syntrophomonadaceae bacterium]|jgi:AraC-like DNA-binding protein